MLRRHARRPDRHNQHHCRRSARAQSQLSVFRNSVRCTPMLQAETAQGARALQVADSRIADLERRLADAAAGSTSGPPALHTWEGSPNSHDQSCNTSLEAIACLAQSLQQRVTPMRRLRWRRLVAPPLRQRKALCCARCAWSLQSCKPHKTSCSSYTPGEACEWLDNPCTCCSRAAVWQWDESHT